MREKLPTVLTSLFVLLHFTTFTAAPKAASHCCAALGLGNDVTTSSVPFTGTTTVFSLHTIPIQEVLDAGQSFVPIEYHRKT
jgi:hypothetical protein